MTKALAGSEMTVSPYRRLIPMTHAFAHERHVHIRLCLALIVYGLCR
jgi:hypothetical protein